MAPPEPGPEQGSSDAGAGDGGEKLDATPGSVEGGRPLRACPYVPLRALTRLGPALMPEAALLQPRDANMGSAWQQGTQISAVLCSCEEPIAAAAAAADC
jgi:hypothetical protein